MADPVEQIFLQSQAGSADGAGFGEFFQRGQQIEQQNQKLDIERQQTRIANATLGLRVREGEAKQLLRVAELEQDTLFAQNYAYWISQGADKKHIPQLMGLVNGTTKGNEVVNDFFERLGGLRDIEDATAERDAIDKEKVAQAEARYKVGQDRAGDIPVNRVTVDGVTFQQPPPATSKTVFDSEGNPILQETTGNAPVGEGSVGITSKFQEQISSHEIARTNINSLREVAGPGSFGVDGLLASANNRLLAPAKAFFGLEPGVDIAFATLQKRLAQVRTAGLKSLKFDTQMNARDFAEVEAGLPEMGLTQTFEEFNVALNELETVNNLGEYVKRRNVDGIPMQPMLDRMGRSEVIEFITRGVKTKLMSKSEARNLLTKAGLGVAGN